MRCPEAAQDVPGEELCLPMVTLLGCQLAGTLAHNKLSSVLLGCLQDGSLLSLE